MHCNCRTIARMRESAGPITHGSVLTRQQLALGDQDEAPPSLGGTTSQDRVMLEGDVCFWVKGHVPVHPQFRTAKKSNHRVVSSARSNESRQPENWHGKPRIAIRNRRSPPRTNCCRACRTPRSSGNRNQPGIGLAPRRLRAVRFPSSRTSGTRCC